MGFFKHTSRINQRRLVGTGNIIKFAYEISIYRNSKKVSCRGLSKEIEGNIRSKEMRDIITTIPLNIVYSPMLGMIYIIYLN